jgi:hypothetical protein
MIRYCESHAIGGKVALNIVSINLTQVSIPAENGSNSHQSSHMPLRDQHVPSHAHSRPTLSCPLKSYNLLTNNQNVIKKKEAFTALIFLLKPQTTN